MKTSLLRFSMLVLGIGVLSTNTFAQDAPGDFGAGATGDGAVTNVTTFQTVPPPGVRSVKRNNGDASSVYGVAEARLTFSSRNNIPANLKLVRITDLNGVDVSGTELAYYQTFPPVIVNNYISYSLGKNLNPAKKLMFYFSDGSTIHFRIPE